ncbi:Insect cuticle protein [Oryctes borbonicus]|uniref:Insect cuticle protein n=1 Tax=Oryctes borbonicus TaxID=1629725 RepID=A0A0T6B608_9SCAR|nr:Insect cuticle protein [Oryctes borbonicus]
MFSNRLPVIFMVSFGMVLCEPPVLSPQYGAPFNGGPPLGPSLPGPIGNNGGPNYYNGNDVGGHADHDHSQAMAYEFGYQVKDDYSGNNYGRQEKSDGNEVRGEYRVQLPDGRTQIVTYYADWQTGFHADVRYEGQAQYPDQYNPNGIPNPNQFGGPGFGVNPAGYPDVPPGAQYAPRLPPPPAQGVDASQGGFNEIPGGTRFDNRNYDRGYNYNNPEGVPGTGYTPINDGINFDNSYNGNINRNKPIPVYGPP